MPSFLLTLRLLPLSALFLPAVFAFPSKKTPVTRADPAFTLLGCFTDNDAGQRALGASSTASDDMTIDKCAAFCSRFELFGVEYGRECYCGNVAPDVPAPAAECSMPCAGNADEACGASLRLNVYKLDSASPTETTTSASPSTTASALPTVSGFEYQGCYTDNVPQRVLGGKTIADPAMTPEKCAATCSAGGYAWFGVEYGSECYCGATLDASSVKTTEGDCAMACSGNQAQICGGPNRINVFKNPTLAGGTASNLATIGEFRYQGCWTDDVGYRSLKDVDYRADDMTVEKCAERCQEYSYFGLQYARECYCGNDLGGHAALAEKECSMLCMGAPTEWCGGPVRLNLYTKVAASTSSSSAESPAVSSSTSASETETATPSSTPESATEVVASSTVSSSTSTTSEETTSITSSPASEDPTSATLGSTTSEMSITSSAQVTSTTSAPSSGTPSPTVPVTTSAIPTTTQGPDLTTITSCPPTPTYNGYPEYCYAAGGLPNVCELLTRPFASILLAPYISGCKSSLTMYGMTPVPAATSCFPTSVAATPPNAAAASSTASSVYQCLRQPSAGLICSSDAACSAGTYTVGQVPSPAPSPWVGVNLVEDGGFESGALSKWTLGTGGANFDTSVSTARPNTGRYSLLLHFNNGAAAAQTVSSSPVRVVPGAQYQFTLSFQHTNPAALTSLLLFVYPSTADPKIYQQTQLHGITANVWTTATKTFTATSSFVQLMIAFQGSVTSPYGSTAGMDDLYVDDISLVRVA